MSLWGSERVRLESRLSAPALAERLRGQAELAGRLARERGREAAVVGGPGPLDELTERTPFALTLLGRGRVVEAAQLRGEIAPGQGGARVEAELTLQVSPGLPVASAGLAFVALGGLPLLASGLGPGYLLLLALGAAGLASRWLRAGREAALTREFVRALLAAQESGR